jgi:hypothetical protein
MKIAGYLASLLAFVMLTMGFASGAGGCSSSSKGNGAGSSSGGSDQDADTCYGGCGVTGGSDAGFSLGGDSGPPAVADMCTGGGHTTISGRVYDPAMVNPLYNVTVFEPAGTLPDFNSASLQGPSCGCSSLYPTVVASTVTDPDGNFTLSGTSSGTVQLVVQVGKWRMQYTISNVTSCQANPQPDKKFRLPKNHTEGDIPQFAISTGSADSLECLPIRMGIDPGEYVAGPGTPTGGHLHIYTGAGGVGGAAIQGGIAYDPGQTLWDQISDIQPYDVVLFSCEGQPTAHMDTAGQQVILQYANNGGRVFASHYHYAILDTGPFSSQGSPAVPLATWFTDMLYADNDPMYGKLVTTLPNGKPFPEGVALQSWLGNVNALSTSGNTKGELEIHYARDNAQLVAADTASQGWMTADVDSVSPGDVMYFSFDTPITGGDTCGRVVYSDLHVSGGPNNSADPNTDYPGFDPGIVPSGCTQHPLTPQEEALEFMIFDLSSCLIPIGGMVSQPPM